MFIHCGHHQHHHHPHRYVSRPCPRDRKQHGILARHHLTCERFNNCPFHLCRFCCGIYCHQRAATCPFHRCSTSTLRAYADTLGAMSTEPQPGCVRCGLLSDASNLADAMDHATGLGTLAASLRSNGQRLMCGSATIAFLSPSFPSHKIVLAPLSRTPLPTLITPYFLSPRLLRPPPPPAHLAVWFPTFSHPPLPRLSHLLVRIPLAPPCPTFFLSPWH